MIRRWLSTGRIDRAQGKAAFEAFDRWQGIDAATAAKLVDPIAEIDKLYSDAHHQHFIEFNALTAYELLGQIVYHRQLQQRSPLRLLRRMAEVMTIYRQSMLTGEADFIVAADRCIKRLGGVRPSDKGEQLAALTCVVAWHLLAVNAQRGQADSVRELLAHTAVIVEERNLREILFAEGYGAPMQRMLQWGNIIAPRNIQEVRTYLARHGNPVEQLDQNDMRRTSDLISTLLSELTTRLRFALSDPAGDFGPPMDFFEARMLQPFSNLIREIDGGSKSRINALATPSTALAVALHSSILAASVPSAQSQTILEGAGQIYRWIKRAGDNSVMLQQANEQTKKFVTSPKYGGILKKYMPGLVFVPDVVGDALIERAKQLLNLVDDCLP